jgi:hypothetical protein
MMGAAWADRRRLFRDGRPGGIVSHRLYPIPLEAGRLGLILLAAGVTYVLSWLAPAGIVPAIAVKVALFGAFTLALGAGGVLRWPARRDGRKALESGERSFFMKFSTLALLVPR